MIRFYIIFFEIIWCLRSTFHSTWFIIYLHSWCFKLKQTVWESLTYKPNNKILHCMYINIVYVCVYVWVLCVRVYVCVVVCEYLCMYGLTSTCSDKVRKYGLFSERFVINANQFFFHYIYIWKTQKNRMYAKGEWEMRRLS